MPARRLPTVVLKAKGSALKTPRLMVGRSEPQTAPLGPPSAFLDEHGERAWNCFVREIPWLAASDRAHLELASMLRGRLMAGKEVGVNALNLLRLCLTSLGGTPADRSKVNAPAAADDDPSDQYFN